MIIAIYMSLKHRLVKIRVLILQYINYLVCLGSVSKDFSINEPKEISYKMSGVDMSICLPVHLSVTHFSQDLLSGFS